MKKDIVVSVIMAVTFLATSFFVVAQPQDTASEEKPTFYRLTPGVYVNGWPRFTVTYPKDWVETSPDAMAVFCAKTPGPTPGGWLGVYTFANPVPLDKFTEISMQFKRMFSTDVTVVSDKSSLSQDGTPVREVEMKMIRNGEPFNDLGVAMKKGDTWIIVIVGSFKGKIGEDLKAIPYSIEFEPGKDEPVKVPPDVQELSDKMDNDLVSHDVAKVMSHYSDRYLNSGRRKGEVERGWRQGIGSLMSIKGTITEFVPAGDRGYLTGFVITNSGTWPITDTSIIKENGEWKWYGNQRDVSP
jgi:hypothetical protein